MSTTCLSKASIDKKTKKMKVNYRTLGEMFYAGMRNELSDEKLKLKTELAKKIKKPKLFGTFDNDDDYLKTVDLFISSTLETRHRGIFFLKEVLPRLHTKTNLLDIGPGSGRLTKWISRVFKNITLVDSSLNALNAAESVLPKHGIQLEKLHTSILDARLPLAHYDLSIMSHLLYHIDRNHWLTLIQKVYSSIKIGGILVIALNDDFDRLNLIQHFGGCSFRIEELAESCANILNTKVELFSSQEVFFAENNIAIMHVGGLYLHDANVTATEDELLNYIKKNYPLNNGYMSMTMSQKFLLISKLAYEN